MKQKTVRLKCKITFRIRGAHPSHCNYCTIKHTMVVKFLPFCLRDYEFVGNFEKCSKIPNPSGILSSVYLMLKFEGNVDTPSRDTCIPPALHAPASRTREDAGGARHRARIRADL